MSGPSSPMPKSLRAHARWERLAGVPALLVHPDAPGTPPQPRPTLLWMHGRTAHKEMDNGRYLRLLRAGIASVALDLPGHGERADHSMQTPERTMTVIDAALRELPAVRQALSAEQGFRMDRVAVGGMSLGGMVALASVCRGPAWQAALVEATTGDWTHLAGAAHDPALANALEPARHLDRWQPLPLLALHAELDEWIRIEWQRGFLQRVRAVNGDAPVDLTAFPRTGAPHEHVGFGSFGPQAKDAGTQFLVRHLRPEPVSAPR